MKLLRRDTDYAFAVLVYLAKHAGERRLSAAELAGALKLPHGFLRKILKMLSREGIVSSSAGKGGGFELIADPETLSAYGVIQAIQGPIHGTACAVNRHLCPNTGHCPVRRVMMDAERTLQDTLAGIRISDLMNGGARALAKTDPASDKAETLCAKPPQAVRKKPLHPRLHTRRSPHT
jgi:Rrf2 family protein